MVKIYPHGVEIKRVASQDYVVEKSVNGFVSNLLQSVVVVLVVMLLFLGLRTGLVVASLIPVTMVSAILLMSIFDVGLNKVTLASLIIALGMLVDNAIVMSESIMVKMEKGMASLDAAIASSKELLIPLLTSSLTTSAAFMAFFLAESVMGEIMGNIFIVLTFALLVSWFLTLTMITLLCVYTLKVAKSEKQDGTIFDKLSIYYKQALVTSLRNPFSTITIILVLFVSSIFLLQFVPNIFMAKSDRALITVNVELPLGTSIDKTQAVISDIEGMVETQLYVSKESMKDGVVSWSSYIGAGAPKYDLGYTAPESSPHAAHILLNTSSDSANDAVIEKVDQYIFNHFPDATYRVSRLVSGGGSANPIEVRLSGIDINELYKKMAEVKSLLRAIPGTKNISDDWGMRSKKLVINIAPGKAQIAGVSNKDIATSLQTVLGGKQTGSFRDGDKVIPIIMQDVNTNTLSIDTLDSLNIYAQQSGKKVPLKQVADVDVAWQVSKIKRRDLNRTITITSDVKSGYTASQIIKLLTPDLQGLQSGWRPGYKYELGGDAEGSSSAMGAVADKIPLSIFLIVLLLIAQFNSIRKPAIILATIPLGIIGVVVGLLITGSYFGFMAFLGVISLAGIVINNGIVLLDRIDIEKIENGRTEYKAIVEAALQRFRPILLTTATTSLGLLPLWLGGGLMWEPMAISIIFGLLFATVLTLLFVPVMYKVLFRVKID
jgi:multidrug efflux pump subunit AcrB